VNARDEVRAMSDARDERCRPERREHPGDTSSIEAPRDASEEKAF
jgi:hypothetical protein